jgi:hypothetical protein
VKPIRALMRLGTTPNGRWPKILRSNLGIMGWNRGADPFAKLVAFHCEAMAIGDLLVRALAIQVDLFRRLSKRPTDKLLRMEQRQHDKLICHLLWEHKTALTRYRAAIRQFMRH